MYPTSSSKCSGCGTCAQECPTEAIDPGDPQHTDKSKCISCMRCVSMCPFSQRRVPKAMQLAAYFSQAREGQNVPVDYTRV